jgi:hypothetical protein
LCEKYGSSCYFVDSSESPEHDSVFGIRLDFAATAEFVCRREISTTPVNTADFDLSIVLNAFTLSAFRVGSGWSADARRVSVAVGANPTPWPSTN